MNSQKNILVTGTSTGIGLATAIALANSGYHVFAGVRKEADFKQLNHKNITPIILDVTSAESRKTAFEFITQQVGDNGLHALVNNAGINYVAPLELMDEAKLRAMMDINVFGLVAMSKEVLPLLFQGRKQSGLRTKIINISSIGGAVGLPWEFGYHASKFAVNGLSQSLRIELAPLGIDVTAVMPGAIKTLFVDKSKENKNHINIDSSNPRASYYNQNLNNFEALAETAFKSASKPEKVGEVVLKEVRKNRSTSRVRVGTDAKLFYFLYRILPANWFEGIITKLMVKKV
jgi:NAD(P)-dependent dehydrogenase (short-subunit alcohol dehydrogenase family)